MFAPTAGSDDSFRHPETRLRRAPQDGGPTFAARAMRLVRRFARQRRATSAVEFALVGTPFIAFAFGIIQTGVMFLAGQSLETVTATAARLIMTGQAQTQGWTAAQFKQQVCNQIHALFNCSAGIYIDVETYASFAAANLGVPVSNGTFTTSSLGYNPGGPGDVVVVRVYYQYPVYLIPAGLSGGKDLIAATAVFQNEPYASS